jgi:hypothetical protein
MIDRKVNCALVFMAVLVLATVGSANEIENQTSTTNTVYLEPAREATPVVIQMRQEFVDSFERSTIAPWTTGGDVASGLWAIRDTLDTYGPQSNAWDGYQFPGHPATDVAVYPSPGSNPGYLTWIASPTIDITGWPAFYLSFSYWADLEGAATNFDGAIVEISSNNGVTWVQVDSTAAGHLNPTYDSPLANTGQLLTAWAYCYTTNPDWVNVSSEDLMALGYVSAGNQVQVRVNFAYDALSGGQGFFIDDFRIADSPPPDLVPPNIVHTPLPDTADTVNNYTVTATITDPGSGVNTDSVRLYYQVEGSSGVTVTMVSTGTNTYEADIPAQSWHTDIWYRVQAADNAGNWGQTALLNFEVTNALTIIYDDGQPNYAPLVVTPGDGCFTRFEFNDVGIDSGLLHQVKFLFEGPGTVDIRIYQAVGAAAPGPFIDSIAGFESPGYQWSTIDLTDLNISTANPYGIFVGYIIGPGDSVGLLRDVAVDYVGQMWNFQGGIWTPEAAGDFMMRLKVIPLDEPGIDENNSKALSTFNLSQIVPSPMKNAGIISYQLPNAQNVSLRVYDVSGKLVRTLIDQNIEAGTHSVVWDSRDNTGKQVASGIYFYRLQGQDQSVTKKMIVVR